MKKNILLFCFIAISNLAYCQFPAPYCAETYGYGVEPITLVTFQTISNASSATPGGGNSHEDFTLSVAAASLIAGSSYTMSIKGNTVGPYYNYFRVFIDWNNDGDFLDAGESYDIGSIYSSTGLDISQASNTIVVPPGTLNGYKRMRVTKYYNIFQPLPCTQIGYGQAEDYQVRVYSMAPYCTEAYPSNVEPITSVNFFYNTNTSSATVNGSPENEDFTYVAPTRVIPGRSYPITVKGNTVGNFINYIRVFVDWNNDYDFLDAGESYDIGTIQNSTGLDAIQASNYIAIPPGTPAGNYRMRVSKKYAGYPPPCNTGGFGQSEDYIIQVYSLAPYCTDSYPSNIEPITKVEFSAISNWTSALLNGTPDNEDFTNINGVVMPGNTYSIKVAGNTDGFYTDYISVYIDWNGNGDFLDPNEVYDIGTIANSTGQDGIYVSGSILVPAGTTLGNKRMRVVKHFGGFLSPCTAYGYGQSEDYTLSVVNSIKAVLSTGNAYLQGDYVEVGINQCGGWGTTSTAPEGYHARSGVTWGTINYNAQLSLGFVADPDKDGWNVGSPSKYNGDYFMPAAPYIGWGINFNGQSYGTDRTYSLQNACALMIGNGNPFQTFSGANISATGYATKAESVWEGTHNGLKVQKTTTVKQDKVYFTARIKLINTTGAPINNIYYGEYINPDPDYYYQDLNTANVANLNAVVYQNPASGQALVQAVGNLHNTYVALGTKDCRARVIRGNGAAVPDFAPFNWYNGSGNLFLSGADLVANNSFYGIAYNIGTLAPGDSTSFLYTYILKATDFDEALSETEPSFLSNNTSIPNDGTITPCANTPVDVTIVDGDYYNWVWSPASGLNTTIGKSVTITPGTTPITYTVTGTGTCATKIITININPVNSTDIVPSPAAIAKCISDPPVLLTASGGDFTDAVILNEKFNSVYNNWTKINNSTGGAPANAAWTLRPNNYIYAVTTFNSNDNTQFYLSNSEAQGNGSTIATILQSPAFSTMNYTSVNLNFYHYFREDAAASTAAVEASTDGVTWTNLQTYTTTTGSNNFFSQETIALTAAFIDQPVVYIRFKYDGSWSSYWAIDNVQVTGSGQPLTWSPTGDLFTDAAGTTPYTGGITTTVYANPAVTTLYTISSLIGNCSKTADVTVTVNNPTNILAGVVGVASCQNKAVNIAGTVYNVTSCDLIGKVTPAGASPVDGDINMCVTLDDMAGPLPEFNAEPYLTRHFDVEPATLNASTATARVTLYFTQEEFDNYNAKNNVWPDLPSGPADALGIANLRITQYHGLPLTTPSSPAQYSGTSEYIDPADVDIVWNGLYWEVTIDVTGFSGFYVHTNFRYILPITLNYFNGNTNGNDNILNWKVNCNNTNGIIYTLERSDDGVHYTPISNYHPSLAQCGLPFSYTDVNAPKGINHYRLKILAPDGAISYSNQVVLSNDYKGSDIITLSPVPVPSDGNFALTLVTEKQGKADLSIMDLQGRVVIRKSINVVKGTNVYNLNIAELAAGTYQLIEYRLDQPTRTIRFVKL